MGPVPMGQRFQTDLLMEWRRISLKYSSCTQGVMVFVSIWGEKAVGSANFKKKSGGDGGSRGHGSRSNMLFLTKTGVRDVMTYVWMPPQAYQRAMYVYISF